MKPTSITAAIVIEVELARWRRIRALKTEVYVMLHTNGEWSAGAAERLRMIEHDLQVQERLDGKGED